MGGPNRLLRVGRQPLADGHHSLHAEFLVEADTTGGPQQQALVVDEPFDASQGITAVSFNLEPSRVVSANHIVVKQYCAEPPREGWVLRSLHEIGRLWRIDGRYVPGDAGDPVVAYAEYLRHSGKAEEAAIELLALGADPEKKLALSSQYWLRTAAVLREVGLWNYARAICNQLDAAREEPQAVAVERLDIALMDYDVGNVDQAEQQLIAVRNWVPEDRVQDWQLAYAQILFLHDQYAEAEKVLQDRDNEGTQAFRYMSQSDHAIFTTALRHYNLAVAMVHNGEEQRGLSLLDLIGRMKTVNKDLIAVRDQANLALGWYFLRTKQGITAMGALGRVGMEGRCSEPALLGMGWAQLAPAGEKIQRVRLDHDTINTPTQLPAPLKHSLTELGVFDPELDNTGGPATFERGDPPQDRREGFRHALLFWQELAKRDRRIPAVQEGLLAIAYADQGLDDDAKAREAYESAIAALETRKKGLLNEAAAIRSDGLSALVDQRPGADGRARLLGAGYLEPSEQNRAAFSAVERYRDLEVLAHHVRDLAERAEADSVTDSSGMSLGPQYAALEDQISRAREGELKGVQSLAMQGLSQLAAANDQYLQEAYFAAARASDQSLAFEAR
mgnify:FL=1